MKRSWKFLALLPFVGCVAGVNASSDRIEPSGFLWGENPSIQTFDYNREIHAPLRVASYLWQEDNRYREQTGPAPIYFDALNPAYKGDADLGIYLWDEENSAGAQVAQYLWDEETRRGEEGIRVASYLWQEDNRYRQPAGPEPVYYDALNPAYKGDADLGIYLWDEDNASESMQVAQYLWDEENRSTDEGEQIAQYLWDEENRSTDEGEQVAQYLWDEETRGGAGGIRVASYLWQEDNRYRQPASPEPVYYDALNPAYKGDPDLGIYLWDEDNASEGMQVAQYLWDEENRAAAEGEHVAQYLWDEENRGSGLWEEQALASAVVDMRKLMTAPLRENYIVTGRDAEAVRGAVAEIGAPITHDLAFINGVGTRLTPGQLASLEQDPAIRGAFLDRPVRTANLTTNSGSLRDSEYTGLLDADELHSRGITGKGVGVAVIDSGAWHHNSIVRGADGGKRVLAYYDAINDSTTVPMEDPFGHGTHIVSVLASSAPSVDENGIRTGSYQGLAPDAGLVIVKAFDEEGRGTYMDVIRGIAYAIAHKDVYNIRVMNLSFSGTPMSHYWQDPLNQAVMAAWDAGIAVIASAGNSGPDPMTIGVPGNVPYVVTVGAMSDNYTPDDPTDDFLTSFSSAGPTVEGFVKPEVVAPGGHLLGVMKLNTTIAQDYPQFHDGSLYFQMSGTSQSAAVASGVAALVLQANPNLSPDDLKCRLMASARAATSPDGTLAYSPFQQGTGLINAQDAVYGTAVGCANQSIDVAKDLAGIEHYGGPATRNEDGTYDLSTAGGYIWNTGGYIWNTGGYIWNTGGYIWNTGGYIWNTGGYIWNTGGYIWNTGGYIWNTSNAFGDLETAGDLSVSHWVNQE